MSGTAFGPDLTLTRSQEGLLRTALSSNSTRDNASQSPYTAMPSNSRSYTNPKQLDTGSITNGPNMYTSPTQQTPGSGQLDSFDESPFLDYENLDDGNFDWDNSGDQLFGDLPGNEYNDEGELHDKRKASADEEDEEEGSSKRREGDDKSAKKTGQKPGRKPLTGEPTTKRKAQNRAAQRAFRERKERHLKDLETKVDDLEKASETANHENGRLRATVDKLQMELKEYRKRMSMNVAGAGHSPPRLATQSSVYNSSSNGSDFSFAFPKFGDLPGSFMNNGSIAKTTSPTQIGPRSASATSQSLRKDSSGSTKVLSPTSFNSAATSLSNSKPYQAPVTRINNNSYDELDGLFSPSILETASRSSSADYISYPGSKAPPTTGAAPMPSVSSTNEQRQTPAVRQQSSTSITGSPASSMSHALDSSCGTTPESSAESPDNRKGSESILDTINEEGKTQNNTGGKKSFCDEWADTCGEIANPISPVMSGANGVPAASNMVKSPAADINGFDWMAQQNGGQFDPVLFGDYRDPQDNILNNSFGDYFNDAFPFNDFASPYNTADVASHLAEEPPKKDFMKEIEVRQNGSPGEVTPGDGTQHFLTCDKLWDRVQSSGIANSGEADMDDLCSQLKSKAKCSGKGAVISQSDVDEILGPAPAEQTDFLKMFM